MKSGKRQLLVALGLWVGYQVVQWPSVRVLYSADDKWAHALAFFAVWCALRWALAWTRLQLALLSAALGAAIEVHQRFLPGFNPSWGDWAADLAGIGAAWLLYATWRRSVVRGAAKA